MKKQNEASDTQTAKPSSAADVRCGCIEKIVEVETLFKDIRFALLREEDYRTKYPFNEAIKRIKGIENDLRFLWE